MLISHRQFPSFYLRITAWKWVLTPSLTSWVLCHQHQTVELRHSWSSYEAFLSYWDCLGRAGQTC